MNRTWTRLGLLLALAGTLALAGCRKPTPEERLTEAVNLMQQGQTARGVVKLKDFVRELPEDPLANQARLLLARYYASESNGQRALEQLQAVFDRAGVSGETGMEALDGMVSIRMQLRQHDEALALFDKAIEMFPAEDLANRDSLRIWKAKTLIQTGEEARVAEGTALLEEVALKASVREVRGLARETLADHLRRAGEYERSSGVYRAYIAAYPDDPLVPQLHLAIAVNHHLAGQEEQSRAVFDEWIAKMLAEAEKELESEVRGRKLLEVAANYSAVGRYDEAETLMLRVMGENTRSRLAIETQFGIGDMFGRAAYATGDEQLLARSIAVFDQIARENKTTNIEEMANQRKAQYGAAMARRLETAGREVSAGDAPTTPTAATGS